MARSNMYPPSVKPGLPKLGNKPKGWINKTFGEVLQVVQRPADLENETEYQLVTAKRNREGIVSRERLKGKGIKTKTQYYIHACDFVISKRQIIHGACGVVPHESHGAIVSNEYSVLKPRPEHLLLEYLSYFSHTVFFQQTCFQASVGVDVEKMVFRIDDWLNYHLYLPPLPEQRQIVQILSTWDDAITTVEQLIDALKRRKKGLMQRLLSGQLRLPEFAESKWRRVRLEDVAEVNPRKPRDIEEDLLVSFIGMSDLSEDARLIGSEVKPYAAVSTGYTYFEDGDVLIAKITPCLENGKGALVGSLQNGIGFGSTEFHVLRAKTNEVLPEYLFYHTISYRFRKQAEQNMVGSAGQKRVSTDFVSQFAIPLPGLVEQEKIVHVLADSDRQIELLQQYRGHLRTQKKGLMQRLLTGQVRVQVEEEGDNSLWNIG